MTVSTSTLQNVLDYFELPANCSGSSMVVVKVLDIHGRIAKIIRQTIEENIDKIRLNTQDLREGNYIINIFTDDTFIKAVRYTKN